MQLMIKISLGWLLTFSVLAGAPHTFQQAKVDAKTLFANHRMTLYCQCSYNAKNEIDLRSCQMEPATNSKRAHRVEFEHMMPAENIGRQLPCWREAMCEHQGKRFKGRKCCQKIDPRFRQAEAELFNLWPSVGLVNQARSNYRYGIVNSTSGFFGCDFKVDKKARKAEPADAVKGVVARANLFMSKHYGIKLSPSQRQLLEAWDRQFPPKPWEMQWAQQIARLEGYENPYITQRRQGAYSETNICAR